MNFFNVKHGHLFQHHQITMLWAFVGSIKLNDDLTIDNYHQAISGGCSSCHLINYMGQYDPHVVYHHFLMQTSKERCHVPCKQGRPSVRHNHGEIHARSIEQFIAHLVASNMTTCSIRWWSPLQSALISLSMHLNWPIRQMDVHNALLHGILNEEVYMTHSYKVSLIQNDLIIMLLIAQVHLWP